MICICNKLIEKSVVSIDNTGNDDICLIEYEGKTYLDFQWYDENCCRRNMSLEIKYCPNCGREL